MHNRTLVAALAVVALITFAVTTAGCTSNTNTGPSPTPTPATQTTTSSNNTTVTTVKSTAGFTISVPSQYRYDQNNSTPVKTYIYLDPANNVTGVNVYTEQLTSNATLGSFTAAYATQLQTYSNFTVIQNTSNGTVDGKPARTLTYQATIPVKYSDTATMNKLLQVQTISTVNNGTGYVITYKAPPNDFSKFLPEAQNIVNSFKLT